MLFASDLSTGAPVIPMPDEIGSSLHRLTPLLTYWCKACQNPRDLLFNQFRQID